MPTLDQAVSDAFVKMIYIGESGSGKTGSLASLALAGYKLRILDMENGLQSLAAYIKKEDPKALKRVEFETCHDNYTAGPMGLTVKGAPRAYVNALKVMQRWAEEFADPNASRNTVFVLDSLSGLGRAAFAWAQGMNPAAKDGRQWYKTAQDSLETMLSLLSSDDFHAHVIVISHVRYLEVDGLVKGHVNAIGQALGPIIPRYFNTMVLAELTGVGKNARRVIRTVPTSLVALKTPAPFKLEDTYPIESGLAELFSKLREL